MPDTTVVRLDGRQAPGASRAEGGCLLVLGLQLAGAGGLLLFMEAVASGDPGEGHPWILAAVGGVLGAAGALLVAGGLGRLRAVRKRLASLQANPGEPWRTDGLWSPEGVRTRAFRPALGSLFALLFLALMLAPFNWMAWQLTDVARLAVGAFDVVALAGFGAWGLKVARTLRHGPLFVRFGSFPFFLGENLAVRLSCRGLGSLDRLAVVLRHVRVVSERVDGSMRGVHYQHWSETLWFEGSRLRGAELDVAFRLPEGDFGTRMGETGQRYWELELRGLATGPDLEARVLVPVYARPA